MQDDRIETGILEELEKIKNISKAQSIRSIKSVFEGMSRTVMRERLEFQQMIFYGSPVISVEGEEFQQGIRTYRNVGFLGYFINMEELIDSWRLWFTTPTGMKFDRRGYPIKNQDYVLHPLCAEGQYIVPKDGGINLLDDGNLILVSRTGLLKGEGGWALAQKYAQRWRELMVAYQQKSMRVEELSQHIERLDEYRVKVEAEKNAILEILKDTQAKYRLVMTNYNRFIVEKDTLMAQLRGMHEINENLKHNLEVTCTNLQKQINDILTIVDTEAIEDSLRASLSSYPKISEEKYNRLRRKWEEEGIIDKTSDEKDEEINMLKQKIEELKKELQETKQHMGEQIQTEDIEIPPEERQPPEGEERKGFVQRLREGAKEVKESEKKEEG